MWKVYGIKNCDTVKKALKHLEKNNIQYDFIDFKKSPPTKDFLQKAKDHMKTWPVNTKGPTFRKIKDEFDAATDAGKVKLMIENSSAVKRPIVFKNDKIVAVGYDETVYKGLK